MFFFILDKSVSYRNTKLKQLPIIVYSYENGITVYVLLLFTSSIWDYSNDTKITYNLRFKIDGKISFNINLSS